MNDYEDIPFFVFDVESIGLYGEAFAVAGGVYVGGVAKSEFRFCCSREKVKGSHADRAWVNTHVPVIEITHRSRHGMMQAFWEQWKRAKKQFPRITMAAECLYPVEALFIAECVLGNRNKKAEDAPYPFHEIASIMLAAGMNPMATYQREPAEMPAHEPLADARQSARLLITALRKLSSMQKRELAECEVPSE